MKQVEAFVPETLRELGEYEKLAALLPKSWHHLAEFDFAAIGWRLLAAELAARAECDNEMYVALAPYLDNVGKVPFALAPRVLLWCSQYHYHHQGLPQALQTATLAQTAALAAEDESTQAEAIQLQGEICFALGEWEQATAHFHQAISLYGEQARPYRLGLAYLDLGATFNRLGKTEAAHTTLERSIKLLSKSHDAYALAIARLIVAESLNTLGEPETAYQYLLFALETFEKTRSKYLRQTWNDLAATLIALKDFEQAATYLQRALADHPPQAAMHHAASYEIKARLHLAQRQFELAETALQLADEQAKKANDSAPLAEICRSFGRLRLLEKRPEEAVRYLRLALEMAQADSAVVLELEVKALLAQALCEDQPAEAFQLVAEVERLLEGRALREVKRVAQEARKRLNALGQEHCFVLSDARMPLLADAREAMLKWMWARSLYQAKGSARKAATILGVTPTYIRRLTKVIPRDLLRSTKKQK
ncbi:MAG: tetratricopeptide repeat protein [Acidobacteria bacterium]|nr:tetratricopeptide repeat protein [Acidobacteriota bacterium]